MKPYKALSNYEVDQYLKKFKGFRETVAKDQYMGTIKDRELGVINMDDSGGPGTHFVCYFNSPDDEHVYYYDSYGAVPPENIEEYLKSSGKSIAYNTTQHQPINSSLCGYYCIKVLKELSQGKEFVDVLDNFSYDPNENEVSIMKEFNVKK
jgi:hypothetical protein